MKLPFLFTLVFAILLSAQVLETYCFSAVETQTGGGKISLDRRPSPSRINAVPTNAINPATTANNAKLASNKSTKLPKAGAEENILIATLIAGAAVIAKKKYMA